MHCARAPPPVSCSAALRPAHPPSQTGASEQMARSTAAAWGGGARAPQAGPHAAPLKAWHAACTTRPYQALATARTLLGISALQ